MAASLNIIDSFSAVAAMGQSIVGNQGVAGNPASTPINYSAISLTGVFGSPTFMGTSYGEYGTLATATALKIYDSSVMKPATWNFFWLWSDQPLYVQFIGSATNFVTQILPSVPFKMIVDGLLAAANTTPITGGSTPTLTAIATVYIANYSGTTANWQVTAYL